VASGKSGFMCSALEIIISVLCNKAVLAQRHFKVVLSSFAGFLFDHLHPNALAQPTRESESVTFSSDFCQVFLQNTDKKKLKSKSLQYFLLSEYVPKLRQNNADSQPNANYLLKT